MNLIPCPFCGGSGLFGRPNRDYRCLRCGTTGWMDEGDYQFFLEGQRMRDERIARGETIPEMAARQGVAPRTIQLRENGWRKEPIREIAREQRASALRIFAEATA